MNPKPIRAAVFSNQTIFLRGLLQMLRAAPSIDLVGEAHTENEIVQLCALTQPKMALVHYDETCDCLQRLIESIRQPFPNIAIVVLTSCETYDLLVDVANDPRVYFLARDVNEEEFIAALHHICSNLQIEPAANSRTAQFHHTAIEEDDDSDGELGHAPSPIRSSEMLTNELAMAGKIQASILPESIPIISGWDISAILLPARETSGDYFDFIPMSYDKWGIVIADVTDKGMAAALFMALSSTLIRTYASRFPTLPALTLDSVNERILSDTRGSMFVSALLTILEPRTGRMVFANAGHPPGFLLTTRSGKTMVEPLRTTGMVLGVSEEANWKQKSMRMIPGDLLVLYTDGITETQDEQGNLFGEERLLDILLKHNGRDAHAVQAAILAEVQKFAGSSARQDDIALVVIRQQR